jgi:hypothetical protein
VSAKADRPQPHCPSARPEMAGGKVFGIVGGTHKEPRVGYLTEPLPATREILALAEPARTGEVFRIAAPCAGHGCQHFDGSRCRLVQRIVQGLPVVVEELPPCALRPSCLWFHQEGKAACLRCPQIVSETCGPSDALQQAADPMAL